MDNLNSKCKCRNMKVHTIPIICPICQKETEIIPQKYLDKNEYKEELKIFENNKDDMIIPQMNSENYKSFQNGGIKDEHTRLYIIGKIKSHKLGMFDKKCIVSDRSFKILLYFFLNHNEKLGGMTFRFGEEVTYPVELLSTAEYWAKYCMTLNKESICIVLKMLGDKNCIFTGDVIMLAQVDPDIRGENWKFQCITANSSMKPNDLRKFISILRDKLEENGEEVRVKISDTLCIIECFRNDKWYQCIAIAPKGYNVD